VGLKSINGCILLATVLKERQLTAVWRLLQDLCTYDEEGHQASCLMCVCLVCLAGSTAEMHQARLCNCGVYLVIWAHMLSKSGARDIGTHAM
jgi:hypothetical protein